MDDSKNVGELYSLPLASLYIFNLIVGAGALSIPQAFAKTGLLYGSLCLGFLAFMSFITITYVVELMASSNAILRTHGDNKGETTTSESAPLLASTRTIQGAEANDENLFSISRRTEMGHMARLFYGKTGVRLFYLCIAIYLYGDLAIYGAAVPKSLTKVTCPQPTNGTAPVNGTWTAPDVWDCFGPFDSSSLYRFYVAIFTIVMLPFAFTNVQKTKYLQLLTSFSRYFAFFSMIIIGLVQINDDSVTNVPPTSDTLDRRDLSALPAMFGVSIYSFMCHHSLPSLVTPVRNKAKLLWIFVFDIILVLVFYLLLSYSAAFRYFPGDIKDIYTLNFNDYSISFFSYFLGLFPVFTLSTSFPVITITLRNNLKTLFERSGGKEWPEWVNKYGFSLLAIIPPMIVAIGTDNVGVLVSITGSYAGLGVQVVIPATLIYFSRQRLMKELGTISANKHASPFGSNYWLAFIAVWCLLCVSLVTYNLISEHI